MNEHNVRKAEAVGGNLGILNWIKRIPGGLLLVPMMITAVIHTFCPELVKIGGATELLFTNTCTMYVVGLMLFFSGTQCMLSQVKEMVRIGGLLFVESAGHACDSGYGAQSGFRICHGLEQRYFYINTVSDWNGSGKSGR